MYFDFKEVLKLKGEEFLISTLPIKPQKETNIGMLLSPTIMDFVGDVLEAKKNIGFNIIHSYEQKDTELDGYLDTISKSKIEYDSIFVDKDHGDQLLEIVDKMYHDGFLKIKQKEKIRCECGRVDMIPSSVNNGKIYRIENGNIICNYCNQVCSTYIEKSLVFELKDDVKIPSICPPYLKKEMNGFIRTFNNSDILVSKNRNTGYVIDTLSGPFNIDVDFVWSNYFKLYDNSKQIYIASNHQLFLIFLMNYLAEKTSNKELVFIANPYLNVDLKEAKWQYELRKLKEYKQLLLLYNFRWKNKNCNWSSTNTTYLNNISDTKLRNLYNAMIISSKELLESDLPLEELIFKILNEKSNMQNNIKEMKRLYKEGRL